MKHLKPSFLLILFIGLIGCAPKLMIKKNVEVKSIGICLNYDNSTATKEISGYFDNILTGFIDVYNSQKHKFSLSKCIDQSKSSLIININSTRLVGPGGQAAGIMLSAVGISLPFIMIAAESPVWVAFIYLPQNFTKSNIALSGDISGNTVAALPRFFASSPYFGSMEHQKIVHSKRFYDFLTQIIKEVEDSYTLQK
jgi:hypothetical protein